MSASRIKLDAASQPLRVLMVVPQFPFPVVGGLEKQSRLLAEELARQGCAVCVLSGRTSPDQETLAHEDGMEVYRLPWPRHRLCRWLLLPWLFAAAFLRLARRCDVVHCHVLSGVGSYAIILARLLGKPIMVKLPNIGAYGLPGLRKMTLGSLRLSLIRRADSVVAMSGESLRELAAIGYPVTRTFITPNGVHLPKHVHLSVGRLGNACRLLFVGRLDPQKGLPDLLQALQIACPGNAPHKPSLDIVGDGDERAAIEAAIKRYSLDSRVRLLGHVDGVPELMPDYDVLVLPSHSEGNSNVVLEAMAAGLPIISTCVGGTPMMVGSMGTRLLHAPGDVTTLGRLIVEIAADSALRLKLGNAMRARAENLFDIRVIARAYLGAYQLLAQGEGDRICELANSEIVADVTVRVKGGTVCAG